MPFISTIGFGRNPVSSESLVPKPPASITASINSKYKIILFSDNPDTALQKLKHLELDITNANEFYTGDEEQFYMLMLTNARIIANSSFSLMSCYMTEMYQFVENVEYRYPDKWFGPIGPTVNFNDIIIK